MLWFLYSIFVVLLIECAIFSWVGHYFGLWATVLCIIITAIIGVVMIRRQGFITIGLLQGKLKGGQFPTSELIEGLWISLVGLLLILPGFFSDFLGLLLILKVFRSLFKFKFLQELFLKKTFNTKQYSDTANIIDGEFYEINNPKNENHRIKHKR